MFDDAEAQAGASVLARAAAVDAHEAVEEAREVLVGHALAGVVEVEIIVGGRVAGWLGVDFRGFVGFEHDVHPLAGIGDGVLQQVAEDAVEQFVVALHGHGRQVVVERDGGSGGLVGKVGHGLVGHRAGIHVGAREEVGALLQLVDDGHVLYEVRETEGLAVAAVEEVAAALVVDGLVGEEYLQVAADGTDGGLQLVGDVGGHLLFQLAVALLGGLGLATQAVGFVGQLLEAHILKHQAYVEEQHYEDGRQRHPYCPVRPIHSRNLFC